MTTQYNLKLQSLTFSALLLLLAGTFQLAHCQEVPTGAVANDPSSPTVNKNYLPPARSSTSTKASKTLSRVAAKQTEIEQTLKQANEARESSNYEKAFSSYRRVAEELSPKDPRAVYGLGNIYFDLGCNDQAMQTYTDALRLEKDFHDALIALGYVYANNERYEEAEARFRAIFRKTPNDAQAKIGLAFIAAKQRRYNDAVDQLKVIIANGSVKNKDRAAAYLHLGNIYLEQKKWEDAAINYSKAIQEDPDLAIAYVRLAQTKLFPQRSKFSQLALQEMRVEDRERLVKAAKEAAEYIRIAIHAHNYKHPFGNLLLANALLDQFSFQEALANVDEYVRKVNVLKSYSSSLATNCDLGFKQLYAFGHLYVALIYNQQAIFEKDLVKRDQYFSRVTENAKQYIEAKESDPAGYELLAQVYLQKGNYSEALRQLEKGFIYETTETSKSSTKEMMGLCYERLGHNKEAISAYTEALRWRPSSTVSRVGLASINEKIGNFDEAIRLNKEVLETTEPRASAFWHLAISYYLRGRAKNADADYEEAIRLLKKALDLNQSFWAAHLTLGNVYKFYKNDAYADVALDHYQEAEKYQPNDAVIKFLIADVFFTMKKNYPAAIKYLNQAIQLNPDYAAAYWQLGLVHRDRGDDMEAIKQLQTALNLDGNFLSTYLELAEIYDRQKNYQEAINILLKAIARLPTEYLPYKELGRVYSNQEKNKEAIQYYEQAINLMGADQAWLRDILRCRILRLEGQYSNSITCAQNVKLSNSADPGQIVYEIGLTHIAKKDKEAARSQYEQLKQMKSSLAEDLLRKINEMK